MAVIVLELGSSLISLFVIPSLAEVGLPVEAGEEVHHGDPVQDGPDTEAVVEEAGHGERDVGQELDNLEERMRASRLYYLH